MRVVILSSSVYSETASAMAVRLTQAGHVPVGALALRALNRGTLLRKVGQWGLRGVMDYARAKVVPSRGNRPGVLQNSYLRPWLEYRGRTLRSLREVATVYDFPVALCSDQNLPRSVKQLTKWSPDVIVFAGGNILRRPLLNVPRLGVLNAHLGLLPEIRGMSSPEWSLLKDVPLGITIHYIDEGIDTGHVLRRCELSNPTHSESISDLRHRLTAFGIDKMAEVVAALDRGEICATPQSQTNNDTQFFVLHDRLRALAADRLERLRTPTTAGSLHD